MNKVEMVKMLGTEIFNRYNCLNHEAFNDSGLVDLGFTEFGTPVFVNRKVFEIDLDLNLRHRNFNDLEEWYKMIDACTRENG